MLDNRLICSTVACTFRLIKGRIFCLLVAILFAISLASSGFLPLAHLEPSESFAVPCQIETYGNAWNGELAYGLIQTSQPSGQTIGSHLIVMKTNGDVEYLRSTNDVGYLVVKNIAPNTMMFMGEPYLGGPVVAAQLPTHFWNYISNTTVDFPNVISHHDIEYDPLNNTFLILQDYVKAVNNTNILFDKILQVDPTGNVLWTWDTYDHISLGQRDPFNPTANVNGETVLDFTHANALDWDYNNSIIYLNLRHTNTFYKINQTTGNIIWACGEHGNFTLLDANGTKVSSLWYHSHGTKEVEPNLFSMFDNDYDNETNPDDCQSRMIDVTVNEKNMTAWISWSWTAPRQYWSTIFGNTERLPNGDRIGDFGSPTHQYPQNQPWTWNNTGAVLVEVDPAGKVVRTYTFPPGWEIYRIKAITNETRNQYSLTANVAGSGSVERNNTGPYFFGDVVQLTANASVGWSFTSWSGDLTGPTNPATMTMDGNKTITATFSQNVYSLNLNIFGSGTINRSTTGPYHYGDTVQVTATPAGNSTFAGWSGDLGGSVSAATITMDGAKNVTATFVLRTVTMTVELAGNGTGLVNRNNTGPYTWGDVVLLTAAPNVSSEFAGWIGSPTGNSTSVIMIGDQKVTATFTLKTVTLTVTPIGRGSVNLDNTGPYHWGDLVQLNATPSGGWSFLGWSGDMSGSSNPATISLNGSKTVNATFTSNPPSLIPANSFTSPEIVVEAGLVAIGILIIVVAVLFYSKKNRED